MNHTEGVIKYQNAHSFDIIPKIIDISQIDSWRTILHRMQLIGQNRNRYQGYGYGNISLRLATCPLQFLISGTQTGHLQTLTRENYCLILAATPKANRITSLGPCKPSSEALTYAMVYRQNPDIQAVIHVHCPEIWHAAKKLQLPCTAADIPYGSPEMADAVATLFQSGQLASRSVFTMLGHEDGVIAFGKSLPQAAMALIQCLAQSLGGEAI